MKRVMSADRDEFMAEMWDTVFGLVEKVLLFLWFSIGLLPPRESVDEAEYQCVCIRVTQAGG